MCEIDAREGAESFALIGDFFRRHRRKMRGWALGAVRRGSTFVAYCT